MIISKVEMQRHPTSPSPQQVPSPQIAGPSRLQSFSPVLYKPKPDLSDERLDHIEKMQEVKSLMPEAETEYYDQVVLFYILEGGGGTW